MELFRDIDIDWLSKKWYFLGFSLIFSIAGMTSMAIHHGPPQGIDFKGGTQVVVAFPQPPNEDHLRSALERVGIRNATLQRLSGGGANEEVITLPLTSDANSMNVRSQVKRALDAEYHDSSFDEKDVYSVGPTAGKQLRTQAGWAIIWSLIGMLIYLWFRFEFIFGAAAVIAVFHDTLITVGAFSLARQEITLTVIAALLTLVGYSMNDTIVVFDRVCENMQTMRRATLSEVVNRSINQTLSRTILTSGLTLLTALSLFLFGGEVLHAFAFALVVGILIGTYSSIAVAAPMLVAYLEWRAGKGKTLSTRSERTAITSHS